MFNEGTWMQGQDSPGWGWKHWNRRNELKRDEEAAGDNIRM